MVATIIGFVLFKRFYRDIGDVFFMITFIGTLLSIFYNFKNFHIFTIFLIFLFNTLIFYNFYIESATIHVIIKSLNTHKVFKLFSFYINKNMQSCYHRF